MSEPRHPRVRELVVELVESAPSAPPFPHPDALPRERRGWGRPMLAAAIVVLLLAVALGAIATIGGDGGGKTPVVTTPRVTGRSIAYVGHDGLYVVPAGGSATLLVEGNDIVRPRFSYDATQLAFEKLGQLWIASTDGGDGTPMVDGAGRFEWSPARNVVAVFGEFKDRKGLHVMAEPANDELAYLADATDFTWMPDGSLLVATRVEQPVLHDELQRVTLGDTASATHTEPYATGVDFHDADDYGLVLGPVSPNGDPVVWVDTAYGSSSVMMDAPPVDVVRDGRAVELGGMFVQRPWAQWSRDGRLAWVQTTGRMVTDARTLISCDAGLQCAPVLDDGSQTTDPSWSPDGSQLAFVRNDASTDPGDYVHDGEPDWRPRYEVRRLWIAHADGSFAHEVAAAGSGVGVPTWTGARTVAYTSADGRLREVDVQTGNVRIIARLAERAGMPPDQVYDPSDANGELQWTDLFAVGPATSLAAPREAAWIGRRVTFEGRDHEAVVDGRRSGLYDQAGGCLGTACGPAHGVAFVVNTARDVVGDRAAHGYLWLMRGDEVRASVPVFVPRGLAPSVDCHRRGDTAHSVFALVRPSTVNGAIEPVVSAWWTEGDAERITELDPAGVECRVKID